MTLSDPDLWERIERHTIGPPDVSLSFADRLARENRWTPDHTAAVILEYKRFCYLARTAGHQVTPSDAVDQAWHLHLTYSRDYWEVFCPEILGAPLHHGPTAGGSAERERYYDQYAATFKAYENAFDEAPPGDIWPSAQRRFQVDPKGLRVNPEDAMILARPKAALLALGLAGFGVLLGWLLRGMV